MACILWLTWLLVFAALGVEARALHMLSARSATDLYPQTALPFLLWDRIPLSCLGQPWIRSGSQAGFAFAPVLPRAPEHLELQVCATGFHVRHVYVYVCPHPGPTLSAPWSRVLHWLPLTSTNSSWLCGTHPPSAILSMSWNGNYSSCCNLSVHGLPAFISYEFHENYQPQHTPHLPLSLENEKLPPIYLSKLSIICFLLTKGTIMSFPKSGNDKGFSWASCGTWGVHSGILHPLNFLQTKENGLQVLSIT